MWSKSGEADQALISPAFTAESRCRQAGDHATMIGMNLDPDWERRSDELWAAIDMYDDADFRTRIAALADELPAGHPVAAFERACAYDSTGSSDLAVPLYREALAGGITGLRRRRSVIQLASSLRNLGQAHESVELLTAERKNGPDELDDAVSAVLALALTSVGREREAVAIAVEALAPHLPRYQRSMAANARALVTPDTV
jgi:hypothetical protein